MKKTIFLIFSTLFLLCGMVFAASIERSIPSSVQPGTAFQVTYNVQGVSTAELWFVSVIDTISGGCTWASGDVSSQFIMMDDPVKTKTAIASSSTGTCIFHGNYLFTIASGAQPITDMIDSSVTLEGTLCVPSWSCGVWGTCSVGTQTRTCTDSTGCSANKIESQTCGIICTAGQTQACTLNGCVGTQTCSANAWGGCVKTDASCGGCAPSWSFGSWSDCVSGVQSRTVTDANSCGVLTGKPATSQTCTEEICDGGSGLTKVIVSQNVGFDCGIRMWHGLLIALIVLGILFMKK